MRQDQDTELEQITMLALNVLVVDCDESRRFRQKVIMSYSESLEQFLIPVVGILQLIEIEIILEFFNIVFIVLSYIPNNVQIAADVLLSC